jgi:hypothetical protein
MGLSIGNSSINNCLSHQPDFMVNGVHASIHMYLSLLLSSCVIQHKSCICLYLCTYMSICLSIYQCIFLAIWSSRLVPVAQVSAYLSIFLSAFLCIIYLPISITPPKEIGLYSIFVLVGSQHMLIFVAGKETVHSSELLDKSHGWWVFASAS